jgi:prepilin-type processing-associated H-X9-DG protein
MIRHGMGTNASFADGHSARWMWKSKETIKVHDESLYGYTPTDCAGKQDLYKVQIACWGKLGPLYPLHPPGCKLEAE